MKLFIVTGVPFVSISEARKYAEALELTKDSITEDTESAASKARMTENEVRYLVEELEKLREEAHQRHARIARELENAPDDNILDRAKAEVLRDNLQDALGYYCGVGDALRLVHNRASELYKMGRARQD